jgi:hypothetical protein
MMNADSKDSRSQSRLEKVAREASNIGVHYEVQAKATREKIARLRALRLAQKAADKQAGEKPAKTLEKPLKAGKKPTRPNAPLSEWLADQHKAGRRG